VSPGKHADRQTLDHVVLAYDDFGKLFLQPIMHRSQPIDGPNVVIAQVRRCRRARRSCHVSFPDQKQEA
jgi:hypothetical protein